ncbi:MAG: hypothetical protein AMXMBFR7_36940 [Planctomycetota bacterium]
MRIFKATYKDRNDQRRTSAKWYGEFKDHNQRVRRAPLVTDKAASLELGHKIERLVALKVSGESPDLDLAKWMVAAPRHVMRKLVEWGVVESSRLGAMKSFKEHLEDYLDDLSAAGNSAKHAIVSHARAKRVIEGCRFGFISDVNREAIKEFLGRLLKKGRIGPKTYGYYVRDLKAFFKWMRRSSRLREDPVEHLEGLGASAIAKGRRRIRRALTIKEILLLLVSTCDQPFRYGMKGQERALVYRLALETGLRAAELASLRRASFHLGAKPATVFLSGASTKNLRDAELPLRNETALLLRDHLAAKLPGAKAFAMPPSTETARMLRADLAAAGIPDKDSQGRVVDFHALRHTFLTLLAASGVHPKVAQDLARHSDINLTLSRYSHTILEQRSEAVDRLPKFDKVDVQDAETGPN